MSRRWLAASGAVLLALALPVAGAAGTIGKVVAIGGHASDLALDEGRGVLYVANFTANRVDVVTQDGNVQTSFNVAAQPSSVALSPDGRYLVVAHYGNFQTGSPNNGLTVIDLSTNSRQVYVLGSPPLGVAFGIDNRALVATASEFIHFDPATGQTQFLGTIPGVTTKTLPVAQVNFPTNILGAAMATSGDGLWIVGSAAVGSGGGGGAGGQRTTTDKTLEFVYDVTTRRVNAIQWTWSPPPGPRAISVSHDGSRHMSGWGMYDRRIDLALNQFANASGAFEIGTHLFDSARGLIYAQFVDAASTQNQGSGQTGGQTPGAPPQPLNPNFKATLLVLDADNLAVRERLNLTENTTGKSVLNSDGSMMYAMSESGILMIPVGRLAQQPRVTASKEDLVFRGNACDRRVVSQEVTILDPGGGNVDFSLSTKVAGVSISPSSGVTPATVRISVDPNAFANQKGTVTAMIEIATKQGINSVDPIRVLINSKEPDQRGTFVNIPGKLVDMLADPARDRFYVLRQERNQVLVFDSQNQTQIATLRTANTPTQMAITFDRRYLLIGHDNAQLIRVYDLETLEESLPIRMPGGHYPRSIAASANAILVASRVAGPKHKISRVDMLTRQATELPALGIYENDISVDTVLVSAPNGGTIFGAQGDGRVLLYNANADTFTVSRKDFGSLSGAYAASSFGQYVINNVVLNSSLVPMATFEAGTGVSTGFSFVDEGGLRATAPNASSPGVIQRWDLANGRGARATRMAEAPILPESASTGQGFRVSWQQVFTRTVAPLPNRRAILSLTQSGFTVLPWEFDAAVPSPRIERVVNAADGTAPVAPGSLVSIYGSNLSPINQATQQMPLPTALGESCLTLNGVPLPVVFVSPTQINGQVPFQLDGNVTMVLRTPGGVSDNFNMTILPSAPSVFRNASAGNERDLPAVYRASNMLLATLANPIHRGDRIILYLTGLGRTSPSIDAGLPAPGDPPASVVIQPNVTIGGVELPIEFAGLAPGMVGVYQITARVPSLVPTGLDVAMQVSQGAGSTALSVRVVD